MAVSNKKRVADNAYYRGAFRWMGVGIEFCLVIGLFCLMGYGLDRLEGTAPGWMLIGFFVGFGVMLYVIIRRARLTQDEMNADDQNAEQDNHTA